MTRAQTIDLIVEALRGLDPSLLRDNGASLDESASLIGEHGLLASIGLVHLIMDVEMLLDERFGTTVTIADERALSQTKSPFRTIGSLADHVMEIAQ